MRHVLVVLTSFGLLTVAYAGNDYEQDINNLAAGVPNLMIEASLRALDSAGAAAFPKLIEHLADKRPAEQRYFAGDEGILLADGSMKPYEPSIGDACFGIIQGQVEGNWPKTYRQYYVLTPENLKRWLGEHPQITLARLRQIAHAESLRRAKADLAKSPSSEGRKSTVAFLRKQLVDAKN